MKALTFCLCSYTSPSLSSRPCSLHRSLSLASLRPGWLSLRWCKGTDTESVQSGILGSSFLAEDKEGPQCLCSGCDPACTGPCVGSSVLVSPVPGCLAPWACLESCLPWCAPLALGECDKAVWEAEVVAESVRQRWELKSHLLSPTWSINHKPISLSNWVQQEQSLLHYFHAGRAGTALWESNVAKKGQQDCEVPGESEWKVLWGRGVPVEPWSSQ